ncbi:MAG: hypothetical protein AB7S39_22790, partial [Gemmatimonadales bacterium]
MTRYGWIVVLTVGFLLLAIWVRSPRPVLAAGAVACWLAVAVARLRTGASARLFGIALIALSLLLGYSQYQLHRIGTAWPAVREARITGAADRWLKEIKYARSVIERTAALAVGLDSLPRETVFDRLARAIDRERFEVGVVVVEADGTPYAWAGRHRLAPEAQGDSIDFRRDSPYYAVLEARRHLPNGRTAVASLLLAADPAVPDQGRSLARRFERRTGVAVEVLQGGLAPESSDVYDYLEPTVSGGSRLLFSIQLKPPTQAAAHELAFRAAVLRLLGMGALVLLLALVAAPPGGPRLVLAAVPAAVLTVAPVGDLIDAPVLFSARTFFHPLLGPVSASAGPLLALAVFAVALASVWLGRRSRRGWLGLPVAAVLALGAPYLVSSLGRGIQVPAGGTTPELWIVWEVVIFLVTAAMIAGAAALVPPRTGGRGGVLAGAAIAVVGAGVGLAVWNARFGWPDWYPLIWAAAVGLVLWSSRRPATLAGIGIIGGSAASLMIWGAEIEDRIAAARADLAGLGARAAPLAVPLLDAFVDRVEIGAAPRSPSELFALWRSSALARQSFPVALGLWSTSGEPRAQLKLDELDLPDSLVSRMARELPAEVERAVVPLQRIPAVHYLALVRLDPGTVLSVGVGPRTALVPPARLGRLLDPEPPNPPLYRLT